VRGTISKHAHIGGRTNISLVFLNFSLQIITIIIMRITTIISGTNAVNAFTEVSS
jgi:hypothetical protein